MFCLDGREEGAFTSDGYEGTNIYFLCMYVHCTVFDQNFLLRRFFSWNRIFMFKNLILSKLDFYWWMITL